MKTKSPSSPRGRPRSFDEDHALEQAMRVFWKLGYEGASLPALTRAMGINRPSLYAAFGNKESLFKKALQRYTDQTGRFFLDALQQPTARLAVEALLRGIVAASGPGKIRGCLLVQGALACGQDSDPIRRELTLRRRHMESLLRQRFQLAQDEGDLPPSPTPAALAKYIATLQNGLAVQAAGGAPREELLAAVDIALRAFP